MKSPVTPTLGRIVIFTPGPEHLDERMNFEGYGMEDKVEAPAMIVRTWENTNYENSEVNLKVLCDAPGNTWRTSIPYDEAGAPGTWRWPVAPTPPSRSEVPLKA